MNLGPYAKAIVALCGAVSVALSDAVLDLNDGITIGLAVLAAVGVYKAANVPADKPVVNAPAE